MFTSFSDLKEWLNDHDNFNEIKKEFDSTSRLVYSAANISAATMTILSTFSIAFFLSFARLQKIQCAVAGRMLFLRFKATTGDAMGMNMISKVRNIFNATGRESESFTFFPQ